MQAIHTPTLSPRYWGLLSIASVFGADVGDFVSHDLHGGHWRGLAPMAVVLAAILLVERRSRRPTEIFYWLAIITVRTAATNLADLMAPMMANCPMVGSSPPWRCCWLRSSP